MRLSASQRALLLCLALGRAHSPFWLALVFPGAAGNQKYVWTNTCHHPSGVQIALLMGKHPGLLPGKPQEAALKVASYCLHRSGMLAVLISEQQSLEHPQCTLRST